MARRATLIDTLRAETPNLLLYDGGSFASDRPASGEFTTRFILRAQHRLGYSAVTLGPRELIHGLDSYTGDDIPSVILSNLHVKRDGAFVPAGLEYKIDEIAGVRVGVFSLLTTSISQRVDQMLGEYEVVPPAEVAREMIDRLRAEDVDVIVLLSQLNLSEARELLPTLPEIDVAIMGHPTTPFTGRPDTWDIVTLYGTARGQAVAAATLGFAADDELVSTSKRNHDLDNRVWLHPDMAALVEEATAEISRLEKQAEFEAMKKEHGAAEPAGPEATPQYLGSGSCAACHDAEHEQWSATAHAGAYQTLVDLGVQNSADCLPCHTVGYGEESGFAMGPSAPDLTGVQCESCHGAGSEHYTADLNAQLVCVKCHDEENSPDFDLAEYMERIRHW